jgi:hypothetical protein|tara:strand:+ start:499 stop:1368 length:870 start_codon:yes stop_codon:yes gene_type:complete
MKTENYTFLQPPDKTKYNVLSLGAGVQSTAMALMATKGEITPMPDIAIFADTQAEPKSVYDHLEWLKGELPFPVVTVTAGSLTEKSLKPFIRKKDGVHYMAKEIPLFGILPDGKKTGAIGRQCTNDFKIQPILKYIRKEFGVKRGQKECTITEWVGISWDEIQRMKDSRVPWSQKRYPLIESRITRNDCKKWMLENGYQEPPRSACYYCPFHNNDDWRHLKNNEPEEFQKAIEFDKKIREQFLKHDKMKMPVFLHNSCKPLDEVDLSTDEERGQMTWDFKSECEGMCGV